MDFERACMIFTMQEPFYGILLSSMNRYPEKKIATLGIDRSGNVFKLLYNPDFTDSLSLDDILLLLKHEVLHVAFNHFSLWEEDPTNEGERLHRNIAEDMEINSYLDPQRVKQLGGVLPSDLGYEKMLGTREYYKLLEQFKQQANQQNNGMDNSPSSSTGLPGESSPSQESGQDKGQSNQNSSMNSEGEPGENGQEEEDTEGANGNTEGGGSEPQPEFQKPRALEGKGLLDDHSQWPKNNDIDQEMLQQEIEDLLVLAEEEVQKACGTVPGEMKVRLQKIREKKPRPVTDWRKYMRRYLGNEFTELIKKSRKRESRRFPDAPGNRHLRKSKVLVAIDTSGSVSMPEYMEFFGQIKTLTDRANFTVLECDTKINKMYEFRKIIPTALSGGGGTNFQPPVTYFNEHRKEYDALIYFTDGYCDIPKDTPKDTLWVVSSKGDHNRKKYIVNGAKVVFIKPTK